MEINNKKSDIIDIVKAWSFPILVSVLSYFGIQTMRKLDVAVYELQQLNNSVKKIEVIQTFQGRDLEKLEMRLNKIETDNTRVR